MNDNKDEEHHSCFMTFVLLIIDTFPRRESRGGRQQRQGDEAHQGSHNYYVGNNFG